MRRYKAVLFAPDGHWVTDYRDRQSVEDVWARIENRGSRWYFYPFPAVIRDHGVTTSDRQRIVDACEPLQHLKGRTIRTMQRVIVDNPDLVKAMLRTEFLKKYRDG